MPIQAAFLIPPTAQMGKLRPQAETSEVQKKEKARLESFAWEHIHILLQLVTTSDCDFWGTVVGTPLGVGP